MPGTQFAQDLIDGWNPNPNLQIIPRVSRRDSTSRVFYEQKFYQTSKEKTDGLLNQTLLN